MDRTTRNLTVAIGAFVVAGGAWLSVRSANPEPPKAAFEATEQEVGKVLAGEKTEVAFRLRNAGGKDLEIISVNAGCGCLAPTFPKKLRPGATGEIHTTFSPSPEWRGQVKKELTVVCNDPEQAEIKLRLVAEVEPLVAVEPPSPLQLQVHRGETVRKVVKLTPREGISISPDPPVVSAPYVKAKLSPDPDGKSHRLELTMGPCNESSDMVGRVSVKTTSPKLPLMSVVAVALQLDGPVASPSRVVFASVASGSAGEDLSRLQVFTRGAAEFRVVEARCTIPELKAEVETDTAGRLYNVRLVRSAPLKSGRITGKVVIRTDAPKYSELSIPVDLTVR